MRRMGVDPPRGRAGACRSTDLLASRPPPDRGLRRPRRPASTPSTSSSPPATPARHGLGDLAPLIAYGASPRATLGLVAAGRALALLRRRSYVLPQDVCDVAPDVLRHRLVLSYDALAQGVAGRPDRDPAAGHRAGAAPDTHPGRIGPPRPARPVARRSRPPPGAAGMSGAAATPTGPAGVGEHRPPVARRDPPPAGADARSPHRRPAPRRPRRPRARASAPRPARAALYVRRRRPPPHRLERDRPRAGAPRPGRRSPSGR